MSLKKKNKFIGQQALYTIVSEQLNGFCDQDFIAVIMSFVAGWWKVPHFLPNKCQRQQCQSYSKQETMQNTDQKTNGVVIWLVSSPGPSRAICDPLFFLL